MWQFVLLLFAAVTTAQTVVSITDVGNPATTILHESGAPIWLRGTGYLKVCIVFGATYPCVADYPSSPMCDAITEDCRCYAWLSTTSDQQCALFQYSPTTTQIVADWQLMQRPTIYASTPRLSLWYSIVHSRFSLYTIGHFLPTVCPLQITPIHPAPCTLQHVIYTYNTDTVAHISISQDIAKTAWIIAFVSVFIPFAIMYIRLQYPIKNQE